MSAQRGVPQHELGRHPHVSRITVIIAVVGLITNVLDNLFIVEHHDISVGLSSQGKFFISFISFQYIMTEKNERYFHTSCVLLQCITSRMESRRENGCLTSTTLLLMLESHSSLVKVQQSEKLTE